MAYEPKHAVRNALCHQVNGNGSGSWLTQDPRPSLELVPEVVELGQSDPERFYDFLLSIAERAREQSERDRQHFVFQVLHEVENLASRTDSHAMHTYAAWLRKSLSQKGEA